MTKKLIVISLALFFVGASELALAKHEMRDRSTVNSSREANSNGRDATDRDKGQERAEDRRSEQGAEHQNADGEKLHKEHAEDSSDSHEHDGAESKRDGEKEGTQTTDNGEKKMEKRRGKGERKGRKGRKQQESTN